jgi:hypothetical protein
MCIKALARVRCWLGTLGWAHCTLALGFFSTKWFSPRCDSNEASGAPLDGSETQAALGTPRKDPTYSAGGTALP